VSKHLLSLSDTDKKITTLATEKNNLINNRKTFSENLADKKQRLGAYEAAHKQGTLKQVLEEHRLRDEEQKIVERRKQLTTMGGGKGGKLVEREIDVSSRSLQMMEERAMKALEEVDQLEGKLQELRTNLEQLETQFENESQGYDGKVSQFDKE